MRYHAAVRILAIVFVMIGVLAVLLLTQDRGASARAIERQQTVKVRGENWATVVRQKELAPGEDLALVVIPSDIDPLFDVKCLRYVHREFRQVVFTCPEARQDQIPAE